MSRENTKTRRSAKRHAARQSSGEPLSAEAAPNAIWGAVTKAPVARLAVLVPEASPDPESAAREVLEPFSGVAKG